MANFENEGFCPCNSVSKTLISAFDSRLFGLWSIIGPKVVCIDQHQFATVNHASVEEMFTIDPITFRLMQKLIAYNSNAEKICIYQNYKDGYINMQSFDTITETFKKLDYPELIVSAKSKFTVIISEDKEPNTIALYFWDLTSCI